MSIAEGTIIKIAQNYLLPDEQTAVNVYWAEVNNNAGPGDLADADVLVAVSNWLDLLYAEVVATMADVVISTICEVWTVNEVTGDLTPVGDEATTWDGTSVNDPLPNGVSAICSMKTSETDVTGRKFLAGYHDTAADDNNLITTALVRLVDFALYWATQYVDANDVVLDPGVYSTALASFFGATGTIIANAIVGYQRRRKPGVGS